MKRMLPLLLLAFLFAAPKFALAHCEVPCGIYNDTLRFQQMLEDTQTIEKATNQVIEKVSGEMNPQNINQMGRWINTKEEHANKIQKIVAQYFLTQRIKPTSTRYVEQLKASHAVMIAAMKCKQNCDPELAVALKKSIYNLYRAYEGKEPNFEKEEKKK